MSELEQLNPPPTDLTVGGATLALTPITIGELPALVRAVRPIAGSLRAAEIDWLALFAEHGEALLAALAIAARKPRAFVDALPADEAITLAAAVLEVNGDFFVRRFLPAFERLIAALPADAPSPAGSTSSSVSSPTATATPTSSL
jgi:hypothetical protein